MCCQALLIVGNDAGGISGQDSGIIGVGGIGYQLYFGLPRVAQVILKIRFEDDYKVGFSSFECFFGLVAVL